MLNGSDERAGSTGEGPASDRGSKAFELPAVDLNCDMGEGMDTDAAVFPFISSANIACGGHAGDRETMHRTAELALEHGVAIGAHPSYPDRPNFGRVDLLGKTLAVEELEAVLLRQLASLQAVCAVLGTRIRHVKPHGALYNRAARDMDVAGVIARTVAKFDPSLSFYGLSGSKMRRAAETAGLRFVSEVFADRTYRPDGSLTPRSEPDALIEDPAQAVAQVLRMVKQGNVQTLFGPVGIAAETICLHGDGPHAVEFAGLIRRSLAAEGIRVAAPRRTVRR
ncbi:MAG TPA: 5-oxoprolinase subunit PxpA [Puia sp.]|nr:5-oxoprolinase subunit PxpA [Puia sp.]